VRSQSVAKTLLLLGFGIALPSTATADTLILQDRMVFGRLRSVSKDAVIFAPQCGSRQSFAKASVKRVERNDACMPRPITPFSAGGALCPDTPLQVYEVVLRSPDQTLLAADVRLEESTVHIRSVDGLTDLHGPGDRLDSMTRTLICRTSATDWPSVSGFCREQVQFAVNFGTEAVFANQILTRGISFYLEDESGAMISLGDPRGAVVREAFGSAVTHWMGALQDLGPQLPADAAAAFGGMISTSPGGFQLLTPPQVVRVACRESAMFVIRWIDSAATPMTIAGRVKAARAQVEGRTIWLNGFTYPCWKSSLNGRVLADPDPGIQGNCFNLTTILTHEVGHALGLVGHADRPGQASVMDSAITDAAARPTPADALELATILGRPIVGSVAGRMDADGAGVEIVPSR